MKNDINYYTFKAKDKNSDNLVNYYVKNFPQDRMEEGVQYMVQNFFEHEVMGKTRRIKSDRVAVEEISQMWRKYLKGNYSIACFKEGCDDIIAMNALGVKSLIDKEEDPVLQSQNFRDIIGVMSYCETQFNPFEHYKVDSYLCAFGLCVDTEYRGRGIATEMLKARAPLMKHFGLKLTTTAFTGPGSQSAARKAGYELNFEISYDDLYKYNPDFYFPGIAAKSFKTMSLVLP